MRQLFPDYKNEDIIVPQYRLYDFKEKEIFVVNTSSEISKKGISTQVHINVVVGNNPARPLKVEPTWVPQHLSASAPARAILESEGFANALTKGVIVLIKSDVARKILSGSDAQEELRRINTAHIYKEVEVDISKDDVDALVSPRVKALFDPEEPIEEVEQYAALRTMTFSDYDLNFIMRQDNVSERIKELIEKQRL